MTNIWDRLVTLLGYTIPLIAGLSTVYAIYKASLRNKQSTKDLTETCKEQAREIKALQERCERNEKQDEKRDAAIEKLADRVYDNKK